jgi:ABC-type branched-subunit amino acid transport system ATPase component
VSNTRILRVAGLHAFIGHFYVLHGVDVEVQNHEIMVLLGRNGAGKTTTLRCVMGLVRAHEGIVELAGENIKGLPPHEIANKKCTLVPEDQGIFSVLTVAENLQVAMRPSKAKKEDRRRLDFAMSLFPDLKQAWNRKAGTLSGGQKQMLALARALINENKLMMLDEPSNDLDVETLRALEDALLEFAGSVMVISHDRWFLDRIATHILAFEGESKAVWFSGNYSDYEKDRRRRLGAAADQPPRIRYRHLTRE